MWGRDMLQGLLHGWHTAHVYISAVAFSSASVIVRVDMLAALTSMDVDAFANDA